MRLDNVPLDETIQILARRAFVDNWFNWFTPFQLENKRSIFSGDLYQQIDGVAMGSPLGPLMAN